AARGTPRTPFFEGCSPSPLARSYASTAAVDVLGAEDVGAASARSGVAIFNLDYDAILAAMYALSVSAEGDCYLCVPPNPGIEASVLGASESALPGTAPAEALHTFTLDSGASRCFFRDSTTLTPLYTHCLSICTCTRTGRHLATFTRWPGSSLYTLATEPSQVAASAQVSASGPVAPPCSCRLLSHQTLLWHHRLGHPSLPRLRGMHSPLLVSLLPRSLPTLLPSPAPPCLPCVEGRQRAAPHSSSFPPTTAPLQTLHMDVKGEVTDVLIPWIRAVRLQLCEQFGQDLPVLRLHSDRGGEFSSDLLWDFCRGEGILQTFTLPDSPQQNGIAKHRIGLVMETSPTLRWTRKVSDASVFRVWGSRAFVRDTFVDKLYARAIPCVFLGFPLDASSWQFYHPTSHRVFPSRDVMFDEAVPFYRLFPYRSAPPPPLPLFLAPGPPPVDPLPPQGPAPSGVSLVDPLPGTVPVEVVVASGAASGGSASGGAEPGGAESEGAGSGGAEPGGAELGGAEPGGVEPGGAEPEGVDPGGADSEGAESGGAEPRGTTSSGGPAVLRHDCLPGRSLSPRSSCASATRLGGAGVTAGAGGTRGAAAAGPGGARTRGTGAAGTGSVGGVGAGGAGDRDPAEPGAGGTGAGGAGAGGAGDGDIGAIDLGAGGARAGGAVSGGNGAGGTVRSQPFFVPLLCQVLSLPSSTGLPPSLLSPPPCPSQPQLQPGSPLPAPSPYTKQRDSFTEHREPESGPASPVRAVPTSRQVPRPRPPPVPGTHAKALRPSSVPLRVPLPPPPESSLLAVPDPKSDLARAASPTVSCLLATVADDPSFESTAVSALVAKLVDFATACRLDYATALVAKSESACPPSVGGESALGTDVLEDRQEDFECLAAAIPRFAYMLLALEGDPDAPDIRTPRSYAEAITGPYSSQWQTTMDAAMASWKSTGTHIDAMPLSRANIVDGMWIFRVKWPRGSPPAFKYSFLAGQPARGDLATPPTWLHWVVSCRYPVEPPAASLRSQPGASRVARTLRTTLAAMGFTPSTADPSLFLCIDTSLPLLYILVYVDDLVFATADTEALTLVKSELQKRHTCTDLGELRSYLGLQITRDRARRTITLTQSHMVHQVLQRFGFQFSSPQPTPLSTGHSLSAPPSEESLEPSGPYPELVGCLMYLITYTRPNLAYPLSLLARYVALGRHRKVHWDAVKRVLRYLCRTLGMGLVLRQAERKAMEDMRSEVTRMTMSSYGGSFSVHSYSKPIGVLPEFTQSLPWFKSPSTLLTDILQHILANMAPANTTPNNAADNANAPRAPDRRGKRPADDNFGEGTSGVEVLLGSNSRAPSEEARATVSQSRVPPVDERVAARQPRVPVKSTPADADGDAGQPGPTLQKRQKAATPVEAAPVNPLASLTAQQMQALLSMLQQHAPVTIATSSDYISAPAKIENQKEVTVPRANKAARVNDTTAAPLPTPVPAPIATQDDSDDSENGNGEAPNNITRRRIIAPAPSLPPLNPTPAPTTFMRKGVRDQAEVFSAIQAHMKHVNFKLQHGDVESALANVAEIESLIHKRFEASWKRTRRGSRLPIAFSCTSPRVC
ncbi:unnamed protein product, partial [Closterium sp. NIES-54]